MAEPVHKSISSSVANMSNSSLLEAAYKLSLAVDKAADHLAAEEIASIVKLHAKIAIASAWIPVPGADLAAMGANTWTMYIRINRNLGIPFSENIIKSLATGIATNLLSNLPVLAMSSVVKAMPGVGTLAGSLMMTASVYAVTIAAGIVYMRALAALLNHHSELTEVNLKAAVSSITEDKAVLEEIMASANNEYRSAKASGELQKPLSKAEKDSGEVIEVTASTMDGTWRNPHKREASSSEDASMSKSSRLSGTGLKLTKKDNSSNKPVPQRPSRLKGTGVNRDNPDKS